MKQSIKYQSLNNKNSEINKGIQILRMILAFLIIQLHCLNIRQTKSIILIGLSKYHLFYVPIFYVISYYFSYKLFAFKNIEKIKLRIQRIIIPYIIWPSLYFALNNLICFLFHFKKIIIVKSLFIQLLTGKTFYSVLWFQCNLILSFILLLIVSFLRSKNFLFNIQLIGIFGYSYYNFHSYYKLFKNEIWQIKSLIHDFSKVLFYSAIGISFGFYIDIDTIKKNRIQIFIFSLFTLFIMKDCLYLTKHFFYFKIFFHGIGSVIIILIFIILPLDNFQNKLFNKIIFHITKFTGGVYYLHTKVHHILKFKISIFKNRTFIGCIANYIICYLICFFGTKLFGKTKFKYLFI